MLSLSHLAELPQLVLLENPERLEVRYPLLSDLVKIYHLGSHLVVTLGVEVLTAYDVNELVVLSLLVHPLNASGRLVCRDLERSFKPLQLRLLNTDELRFLSTLQLSENVDALNGCHLLDIVHRKIRGSCYFHGNALLSIRGSHGWLALQI